MDAEQKQMNLLYGQSLGSNRDAKLHDFNELNQEATRLAAGIQAETEKRAIEQASQNDAMRLTTTLKKDIFDEDWPGATNTDDFWTDPNLDLLRQGIEQTLLTLRFRDWLKKLPAKPTLSQTIQMLQKEGWLHPDSTTKGGQMNPGMALELETWFDGVVEMTWARWRDALMVPFYVDDAKIFTG